MSLKRPRYVRVDLAVDKLLQEHAIADAPVPIEHIAIAIGARIEYREFDQDVSGVLVRTVTESVIGVALGQSKERQRFTVAHELGHLLLHEGKELHIDKSFRVNFRSSSSSSAEDVEEVEANAFAAAILMPKLMLRRDASALDLDFEQTNVIARLAKRYEVSEQAMTFRLSNLFRDATSA
jgi:Zn-dependent peptidase ImmA (M78 family)